MKIEKIKINNIPSIVWGEKSSKVFIAIHGNMSNKEDEVIKILAKEVVSKGYQLLSFDLPEHGERKEDTKYLCKVQNCVDDLKQVIEYVKANPNMPLYMKPSYGKAYMEITLKQLESYKKG